MLYSVGAADMERRDPKFAKPLLVLLPANAAEPVSKELATANPSMLRFPNILTEFLQFVMSLSRLLYPCL